MEPLDHVFVIKALKHSLKTLASFFLRAWSSQSRSYSLWAV